MKSISDSISVKRVSDTISGLTGSVKSLKRSVTGRWSLLMEKLHRNSHTSLLTDIKKS